VIGLCVDVYLCVISIAVKIEAVLAYYVTKGENVGYKKQRSKDRALGDSLEKELILGI